MTLVIANLDAEAEVAGIALPERVLRTVSALGTLMRVFASDLDVLWTPRPVDPMRLPEVEGLGRPRLVSGPVPDGEQRLSWATTGDDSPFAQVAHRGFALEVARGLDLSLPGARLVRSRDELRDHLAAGGADLAPEGRWVLKAPWSAAGRWRLFESADEGKIERFFTRFGEGLFEPWLARTADRGVCAEVGEGGDVRLLGAHEQTVDAVGRCQGIGPLVEPEPTEVDAATAAGRALAREGHRGPFGIDGWRGLDREGRERTVLLGEINPRLTMGRVSREILARVGGERLLVGTEIPDRSDVVPVLLPGPDDPAAAWIDTEGPRA